MTNADVAKLTVELNLAGNFTSGIGAAESATSRFGGIAGRVQTAASKVGGALGHAANQIKSLGTNLLAIAGVGGLLSLGGALTATIGKLNDLAFGTEKLQALTGGSAQSLSVLIAAADKYGISLDQLTASAGFYEKNVNKVISANKDLAKVLTDSTGKALPFDQALLAIADVYATSTDKAKAAAEAASIFGRSYTNLVPILALGKQGIIDLETEAAKMGFQLSAKNVADFAAYRTALRGAQEAIAGLEVTIGEDLLPTITDLANGIRSFVSDHKTDIVAFFHNAVAAGRQAASIIGGLASAVGSFWNSIPPGVRDLLTKGLVADRTVKFLFGFSPITSAVGGIFDQFLQRGSSPANPLFVTGLGVPGLGPIPNAGNGAGIFETLFGGSAITAFGTALALVFAPVAAVVLAENLAGPGNGLTPDARKALAQTGRYGRGAQYAPAGSPSMSGTADYQRFAAQEALAAAGVHNFAVAVDGLAVDTRVAINKLTERLQHPLAPHSEVNALLTKADKIANSSETTAQKIRDLEAIKAKLDAGNHHQAYYLQRIIAAEKAQKPPVVNVTTNVRINSIAAVRLTTTNTTWRNTSGGPVIS